MRPLLAAAVAFLALAPAGSAAHHDALPGIAASLKRMAARPVLRRRPDRVNPGLGYTVVVLSNFGYPTIAPAIDLILDRLRIP